MEQTEEGFLKLMQAALQASFFWSSLLETRQENISKLHGIAIRTDPASATLALDASGLLERINDHIIASEALKVGDPVRTIREYRGVSKDLQATVVEKNGNVLVIRPKGSTKRITISCLLLERVSEIGVHHG